MKKKTAKRIGRPPSPGPAPKIFNFKVTLQERKVLDAKAKKYQDGNLSAWVRRASLEYSPPVKAKTKK